MDPTVSGSLAGYILKVRNNTSSTRMLELGLSNALSYLQVQGDAYERMFNAVTRVGELLNQMQDATKRASDSDLYVKEFVQMQQEIKDALKTEFNGRTVVSEYDSSPMEVYLTPDGKQKIYISESYVGLDFNSPNFSASNFDWMTLKDIAFTVARDTATETGVLSVVTSTQISNLISDLSDRFSINVSQQAQVLDSINAIRERNASNERSASMISDVNVAFEVAKLNQATLRFHGAVASMTQSNVLADAALRLLSSKAS